MKLGALLGKPIHGETLDDPELPVPDAKLGIEVEIENWDGWSGFELWSNHVDDSLRNNGQEFTTNGGLVGADIRRAVTAFCEQANARNWDWNTPRAGIHIHLDITDLDFEGGELARLVANYIILEHVLFAFAGDYRRSVGYCESLEDSQGDFALLGKFLYGKPDSRTVRSIVEEFSKYQAINLKPMAMYGTVEFRHLPTTFESDRLMTWINIILAIKRSAKQVIMGDSPLKALSQLGWEEYIRRLLGQDLFDMLRKFVEPKRIWTAVDNATALMAYSREQLNITPPSWKDLDKRSPVIVAKLAKMKAAAAKKEKEQPKKVTGPPVVATQNQIAGLNARSQENFDRMLLQPTPLTGV